MKKYDEKTMLAIRKETAEQWYKDVKTQWKKALSQAGLITSVTTGRTHEINHMVNGRTPDKIIKDQLDRCIRENKASSTFLQEHKISDTIENAILRELPKVILWSYNKHPIEKDITLRIDTRRFDEVIGTGIRWTNDNKHLVHANAYRSIVILEKDTENQFGFTRITAYPNVKSKSAELTGLDLLEYMKDTKEYKRASSSRKAELERMVTKPGGSQSAKKPLPIQPVADPGKTLSGTYQEYIDELNNIEQPDVDSLEKP